MKNKLLVLLLGYSTVFVALWHRDCSAIAIGIGVVGIIIYTANVFNYWRSEQSLQTISLEDFCIQQWRENYRGRLPYWKSRKSIKPSFFRYLRKQPQEYSLRSFRIRNTNIKEIIVAYQTYLKKNGHVHIYKKDVRGLAQVIRDFDDDEKKIFITQMYCDYSFTYVHEISYVEESEAFVVKVRRDCTPNPAE